MYEIIDNLNDELRYKIKEKKKALNNMLLVGLVWLMLVIMAGFLANYLSEYKTAIIVGTMLSIIPLLLFETLIWVKVLKIKEETTQLKTTRSSIDINEV